MNIKLLFYLAIGLIWLISKILEAKNKPVKAVKPAKEVVVLPDPKPTVPQRKLPVKIPKRQPQTYLSRSKSLEKIENDQKVVSYEKKTFQQAAIIAEAPVMQEVQILNGNNDLENSFAKSLSEEIRSGNFDWKRAVVINELLKQQHFR